MTEKSPIIGIDLGTTYSRVSVYRHGKVEIIENDQGNYTTPSYIAFNEHRRSIGDSAKNQITRNPSNVIFDTKRLIGRKFYDSSVQSDIKIWPFDVINDNDKPKIKVMYQRETKFFLPEEICAMLLSRMRENAEIYLETTVTTAVIAVPANFNDSQRRAIINAATIAGFSFCRIISEPIAAAATIAYGLDRTESDMDRTESDEYYVVVFDLGGGTFDVSVINIDDTSEVISTAGDTHLGCIDFDNCLVNHFDEQFKNKYKKDLTVNKRAMTRLRIACEKVRETLSSSTQTSIEINSLFEDKDFYSTITRVQFEELNANLFSNILELVEKALSDSKLDKSEISDIVLVGGGSRIPKIQNLLQDLFNGKKLNKSINPDEAVVCGAAIQSAILNQSVDLLLLDVNPLTVGTTTADGAMEIFMKRNSTLPNCHIYNVTTSIDNQHVLDIQVYEGEHKMAKDNKFLGNFRLNDIPLASRGKPEIEVKFDISIDGVMGMSATVKYNEKESKLTITNDMEHLSKEEIEKMIKDAKRYKDDEDKQNEYITAKNSLESYVFKIKTAIEESSKNKISENDRKNFLHKIDETLEWLEENDIYHKDKIEDKQKELQSMCQLFQN